MYATQTMLYEVRQYISLSNIFHNVHEVLLVFILVFVDLKRMFSMKIVQLKDKKLLIKEFLKLKCGDFGDPSYPATSS